MAMWARTTWTIKNAVDHSIRPQDLGRGAVVCVTQCGGSTVMTEGRVRQVRGEEGPIEAGEKVQVNVLQ